MLISKGGQIVRDFFGSRIMNKKPQVQHLMDKIYITKHEIHFVMV